MTKHFTCLGETGQSPWERKTDETLPNTSDHLVFQNWTMLKVPSGVSTCFTPLSQTWGGGEPDEAALPLQFPLKQKIQLWVRWTESLLFKSLHNPLLKAFPDLPKESVKALLLHLSCTPGHPEHLPNSSGYAGARVWQSLVET